MANDAKTLADPTTNRRSLEYIQKSPRVPFLEEMPLVFEHSGRAHKMAAQALGDARASSWARSDTDHI